MDCRRILTLSLIGLSLLELCCDSDRLSPETKARIRQAHERMLTVDGHVGPGGWNRYIDHMEAFGLDAAFFVISVPNAALKPGRGGSAREKTIEAVRGLRRLIEGRPEQIGLALSAGDAYGLEKQGRTAAYLGVEYADGSGTDPGFVAELYREGVRILTLWGNEGAPVRDPAFAGWDLAGRGLSDLGERTVAECNRLGMIIELADCPDRSTLDVLDLSAAPLVVARSAGRSLSGRPGVPGDEAIRAVTAKGGVVLVPFAPRRSGKGSGQLRGTTAAVADRIEHVILIGGLKGVGVCSGPGPEGGAGRRKADEFPDLTTELLRRGYEESAVESIWGGNIMRVFQQVEAAAVSIRQRGS